MAQINLLPWREERRAERKKEFLTGLALVAMAAVLLLFIGDQLIKGEIGYQERRNAHLRQSITQPSSPPVATKDSECPSRLHLMEEEMSFEESRMKHT